MNWPTRCDWANFLSLIVILIELGALLWLAYEVSELLR